MSEMLNIHQSEASEFGKQGKPQSEAFIGWNNLPLKFLSSPTPN